MLQKLLAPNFDIFIKLKNLRQCILQRLWLIEYGVYKHAVKCSVLILYSTTSADKIKRATDIVQKLLSSKY